MSKKNLFMDSIKFTKKNSESTEDNNFWPDCVFRNARLEYKCKI